MGKWKAQGSRTKRELDTLWLSHFNCLQMEKYPHILFQPGTLLSILILILSHSGKCIRLHKMLACVCVSSPLTTLNASNSIQFDSLVRSLITANIFIMCAYENFAKLPANEKYFAHIAGRRWVGRNKIYCFWAIERDEWLVSADKGVYYIWGWFLGIGLKYKRVSQVI